MIRLQVLYPHPYPLPPPSSFLLAPPCSSSSRPPLAHGALWGLLCLCWCQHRSMPTRPPSPPPRWASEYLLACPSVILSFGPRCPLTHLTHTSLLCSHHLQSSPNTAGLWWTLFLHERDRSTQRRRAKSVETVWEASAQPPPPDPHLSQHHPSHCMHGQTALGELSARPLWLLALTEAHRNLLSLYCTGSVPLCY